jgi:hypothetical protein
MPCIKETDYFAEAYVGFFSINIPLGKRRQIDCDLRAVLGRLFRSLDRFDLHQLVLEFVVLSHSPSLLLFRCYYLKVNFRAPSFMRAYSRNTSKPFYNAKGTGRATSVILTPPLWGSQTQPRRKILQRHATPNIVVLYPQHHAKKFYQRRQKTSCNGHSIDVHSCFTDETSGNSR